jgi:integrase
VTVQRCDEWIAERLRIAKRSTVVTERGYLAPIWRRARRHRIITENPWEVARVPGKPSEAPPKFWTADELTKLADACEGWLRDWVLLDANTGLRVSALLGLRWGDVSFDDNRLTVPAHLSKSGKPYSVPLSAVANEVLMRRWTRADDTGRDAFIFPGHSKSGTYLRGTVFTRLKFAVAKAGIRDFGHYCHAIRHSFAVAAVRGDVHLRIVQAWLGHSSIRTTEIYAKLAPDASQAAMDGFGIGEATRATAVNPRPRADRSPNGTRRPRKARPRPPDSGTSSPPAKTPS